ncbi:MAG: ABC transporter ATP-binding protein, partial [Candidatus Hydrogenedentota bacterium]
ESPYFYEYLNPRETLDFYGRLEGLSRAERAREWDTLSEMLDLRDIAEQRVRGFSKGMRQRLGFAVALAGDPKLLVLDEPMSGLDPSGRRTIRELILRMRDAGKTVFFSSHILGDVEQICDRVAIIRDGRLTVEGRVDVLLTSEIKQVEVIADGIGDALMETLQRRALSARRSEAGRHFVFADAASANDAVRQILQADGRLIEFLPLKESLEDYFMRELDRSTSATQISRSAAS